MSIRKHRLITHDPTQPKVTQLHIALAIDEDIARLQVSMQYLTVLPPVALEKTQSHLRQDLPRHFFGHVFLRLFASFDVDATEDSSPSSGFNLMAFDEFSTLASPFV